MARTPSAKAQGPSRVRFIMFDAELTDGDLGQVTQVIQNAFRLPPAAPSSPRAIAQRMAASTNPSSAASTNSSDELEAAPVDDIFSEVSPQTETPATQPRQATTRKLRTPKVLSNLELESGVSFASFAQAKNPPKDQPKFLVVAAWFKLHRNLDAITVDHVYTCFRAAGWSTAIGDFSAPLRSLKASQLMDKTGKGTYAINHLGLARVDKMGG